MIHVLHFCSLVCIDRATNRNKVYYLQVIATSGGYAAVAQFGRIGNGLQERLRTPEHVSYDQAIRAYQEILADKLHEYDIDVAAIPDCPRYADQEYYIVPADEVEAFRAEREASFYTDPGSAERLVKIKSKRETRLREAAARIERILRDPATQIDKAIEPKSTIEKAGAQISCVDISEGLARAVALEIGGSFKARGTIIGECFHIFDISSPTASRADLLKYARPHIVTMEPPIQNASTHGEMLAAVRAILERRSTMPIRLLFGDGERMSINPVDLLSYNEYLPPDVFDPLKEPASS